MKHWMRWIVIFGTLLFLTGCNGLSQKLFTPKIEPHPDAPILVTDTFGGFVKGAVYDKERNAMVPCGWFWIGRYDGWTLHKFDWDKRIAAEKTKKPAE
jgi:hypothetical protein